RPNGVELGGDRIEAREVVIAAGAWSGTIAGALERPDAVRPARGQMVCIESPRRILRRPVEAMHAYLVPRDDGRILVGATVEDVGFDSSVTAWAVRDLLAAAARIVPAVESCRFREAWAGLRPRAEQPIVERVRPGLVVATGHFRNGILLAPHTAERVARLVAAARGGSGPRGQQDPRAVGDTARVLVGRGERSVDRA